MAVLIDFPEQQFMKLTCGECGGTFKYALTGSNNYPKFCGGCRKTRTAANKRRFDERRAAPAAPEGPPAKDVHAMLERIPDYVMKPVKIIDAVIRDLG